MFKCFGKFSKHGLHISASHNKCKAVFRRCFSKSVFLKVSQSLQENTYAGVSFNKLADLKAWNFIKKRLQRRFFSCEICGIFKSTFSTEHFWWLLLEMERHFIVFPFFITMIYLNALCLNLSWWRSLLYRNQSFDFLCKSMDWFLYDKDSIMKELIDIHILALLFNLHTEREFWDL